MVGHIWSIIQGLAGQPLQESCVLGSKVLDVTRSRFMPRSRWEVSGYKYILYTCLYSQGYRLDQSGLSGWPGHNRDLKCELSIGLYRHRRAGPVLLRSTQRIGLVDTKKVTPSWVPLQKYPHSRQQKSTRILGKELHLFIYLSPADTEIGWLTNPKAWKHHSHEAAGTPGSWVVIMKAINNLSLYLKLTITQGGVMNTTSFSAVSMPILGKLASHVLWLYPVASLAVVPSHVQWHVLQHTTWQIGTTSAKKQKQNKTEPPLPPTNTKFNWSICLVICKPSVHIISTTWPSLDTYSSTLYLIRLHSYIFYKAAVPSKGWHTAVICGTHQFPPCEWNQWELLSQSIVKDSISL